VTATPRTAEPRPEAAPEPSSRSAVHTRIGAKPVVASADPRPNSGQSLDEAIAELGRRADLRPTDMQAQLRLRMLLVAAGRYKEARAPWVGGTADQQRLLNEWVEAAIALASAEPDADGDSTDKAMAAVENLRHRLAAAAPLRVRGVGLVSRVDGFGVITPFPGDVFQPGQWVIVYCELDNFASRITDDGQFETRLSLRIEVLSAEGASHLVQEDKEVVDRSRNQRRDFFLARRLRLPANLPPGEYVVRVSVTDRVAGKVGESITRFSVK
jgi:hypothetical protein